MRPLSMGKPHWIVLSVGNIGSRPLSICFVAIVKSDWSSTDMTCHTKEWKVIASLIKMNRSLIGMCTPMKINARNIEKVVTENNYCIISSTKRHIILPFDAFDHSWRERIPWLFTVVFVINSIGFHVISVPVRWLSKPTAQPGCQVATIEKIQLSILLWHLMVIDKKAAWQKKKR